VDGQHDHHAGSHAERYRPNHQDQLDGVPLCAGCQGRCGNESFNDEGIGEEGAGERQFSPPLLWAGRLGSQPETTGFPSPGYAVSSRRSPASTTCREKIMAQTGGACGLPPHPKPSAGSSGDYAAHRPLPSPAASCPRGEPLVCIARLTEGLSTAGRISSRSQSSLDGRAQSALFPTAEFRVKGRVHLVASRLREHGVGLVPGIGES